MSKAAQTAQTAKPTKTARSDQTAQTAKPTKATKTTSQTPEAAKFAKIPIPKLRLLIFAALLLALRIVLSRFFAIRTPIMKISLGFLPTMLCATWLGPKWAILINLLDDLIGAVFFPSGPFFIGYTISAVVAAAIYGFLLYRRNINAFSYRTYLIRVIIAVVAVALIVNLGLNTLWTSITAGKAFWPLLATRVYKQLLSIPVNIIIFLAVEALLRRPLQNILWASSEPADPISPTPAQSTEDTTDDE